MAALTVAAPLTQAFGSQARVQARLSRSQRIVVKASAAKQSVEVRSCALWWSQNHVGCDRLTLRSSLSMFKSGRYIYVIICAGVRDQVSCFWLACWFFPLCWPCSSSGGGCQHCCFRQPFRHPRSFGSTSCWLGGFQYSWSSAEPAGLYGEATRALRLAIPVILRALA